jgi:hypothetical protein
MNIDNTAVVTLPHGLWLDQSRYQEAELRAATGSDEAFLIEAGARLLSAQRTTVLLARCLERIGPVERVTEEMVRSLTVGDRERLLLELQRLTFGERMQGVLTCPNPQCGERMDLELNVGDLIVRTYSEAKTFYELEIEVGDKAYRVRFRLPSGDDQEAIAELARVEPSEAVRALMQRCVDRVTSAGGDEIDEWPAGLSAELSERMSERDPQAELSLTATCPACGHDFESILDTASYFIEELMRKSRLLFQEVHWLAFYYHWSEAEIMNMSVGRRSRYLDLLSDALSERASG